MKLDLAEIGSKVKKAVSALLDSANLEPGGILVVGCSTSEVMGNKIGSASNVQVAKTILETLLQEVKAKKIFLAVQCCEHLNRALVVEKELAQAKKLEIVTVYPAIKAGGALAAMAMEKMIDPVVVENIKADIGMDIGDTFIGMHLKPVVIPVRISIREIGNAHLTLAFTRPKLIGGARAVYCKS